MSNRTLVELNHDYCPKDEELLQWAKDIRSYMRTGTVEVLPTGVTFKHFRHHSEPDPLEIKQCEVCSATECLTIMGPHRYACPKHRAVAQSAPAH